MKLMRLAMCVAVFALVGKIAFAQDMDIRALQAKLAAQEARLNDLQAKMNQKGGGGTADNVVSLRKNAKVTIGGDIQPRYLYQNAKIDTKHNRMLSGGAVVANDTAVAYDAAAGKTKIRDLSGTDFRVNDAKMRIKVDVNEYFEAFMRVDFQDSNTDRAFTAQEAYVRWKNVCNSGFGLLVGRTELVFGGGNESGAMYTGFYGGSSNDSILDTGIANPFMNMGAITGTTAAAGAPGMFAQGQGMAPTHIGYDFSRTTQITPYWQSQDGRFKFELSYMQQWETRGNANQRWADNRATYTKYDSINGGFGSGAARFTWKPIEGLKLVASAINLHNDVFKDSGRPAGTIAPTWRPTGAGTWATPVVDGSRGNANDYAVNLHVAWNPCFLPKFKIWGAWVREWNAGWVRDLDVDTFQLGVSYKFTDKFMAFAMGEYMKHKNGSENGAAGNFYKSKAWASYIGAQYNVGYGVMLEAGWRHEDYKFKDRGGDQHTTAKADSVYGRLVFGF